MDKEFKNYEVAFLVKSEEDREKILKNLNNFQFPIIHEGKTTKIKLAYPIKKENFAYFGYLHFSAKPEEIKNLTSCLKNESGILRFLIVAQPFIKKEKDLEIGKVSSRPIFKNSPLAKKKSTAETLSNEALEKKLEEILK